MYSLKASLVNKGPQAESHHFCYSLSLAYASLHQLSTLFLSQYLIEAMKQQASSNLFSLPPVKSFNLMRMTYICMLYTPVAAYKLFEFGFIVISVQKLKNKNKKTVSPMRKLSS